MPEGPDFSNFARESKPLGGRLSPEKSAMSEDQGRSLIEATREVALGPLRALMVTMGLQRGEALGLGWKDFDGSPSP